MGDQIGQNGPLGLRERLGLGAVPRWLVWVFAAIWGVLFAAFLFGVFWVIVDTGLRFCQSWFPPSQPSATPATTDPTDLRWSLLTLTALMAALGAVVTLPITLVRVQYVRRQTEATEQGLITDRINNAVEALGTEKVVKVLGKDADYNDITVEETVPNMEVRIGAIHALARIARDNLNFHVQVMEILCAYIRENAPASGAEPLEMPETPAEDVADPAQAWWRWNEKLWTALNDLESRISPRSDIQTALSVLGRRTPEQQAREAGFPDPDADKMFIFAEDYPTLPPAPEAGSDTDRAQWEQLRKTFEKQVEAMRDAFDNWPGYRLDLRDTNLQGYDLRRLDLRGARFDRAQMQGASLRRTQMLGAYLRDAQMQVADLTDAQMQGAILVGAKLQAAQLGEALMQGTNLNGAQMQGSDLRSTQMQQVTLYETQMQVAFLLQTQLDHSIVLYGTDLTGAKLYFMDLSKASIEQTQIDACFGNARVKLPPGLTRPAHWPRYERTMESRDASEAGYSWGPIPNDPTPPEPDTPD